MDIKYIKKAWSKTIIDKETVKEYEKLNDEGKTFEAFCNWNKEQLTRNMFGYLRDKVQWDAEMNDDGSITISVWIRWYDEEEQLAEQGPIIRVK